MPDTYRHSENMSWLNYTNSASHAILSVWNTENSLSYSLK